MKKVNLSLLFTITTNLLLRPTFASSNKILLKEKLTTNLDVKEVFFTSPIIYSVLITLSIVAFTIWLYCLFTFRVNKNMSPEIIKDIKSHLLKRDFDKALTFLQKKNNLFSQILSSAIEVRSHGPQYVTDTMKAEGKRFTTKFWQRISLLNEIVIVAPMLGLLGTVIGMFYAFYDINRSIDSIASLFDGLGIAIGTTVAGLIVAIISMIFHATLKYRLIRMLNAVETEAYTLTALMQKSKIIKKKQS